MEEGVAELDPLRLLDRAVLGGVGLASDGQRGVLGEPVPLAAGASRRVGRAPAVSSPALLVGPVRRGAVLRGDLIGVVDAVGGAGPDSAERYGRAGQGRILSTR